ncbi:MAG TPA: phosphoadenosine phosphosulfate reductase, partial [Thermoplasmatales archaeon]|nr:phosphoadenosine phosphosulfate reductase [Thermoplasmatales archaeon]
MIRLGKLVLHHCDFCNLPLLKEVCICGNAARKVAVTPPGDVRPAFARDRELMKEVMERQFGSHHIPEVVLLNSAPAIDKKDEVIMYG